MSHSVEANKYAAGDLCYTCDRYLGPKHYQSRKIETEKKCKECRCVTSIPSIKAVEDLKPPPDVRTTKIFPYLLQILTTEDKVEVPPYLLAEGDEDKVGVPSNESGEPKPTPNNLSPNELLIPSSQMKNENKRTRKVSELLIGQTPQNLPSSKRQKISGNQNLDKRMEELDNLKVEIQALITNITNQIEFTNQIEVESDLRNRLEKIQQLLETKIQKEGRKLFLLYCIDNIPFSPKDSTFNTICSLIRTTEDLPSPKDCEGKNENLKKNHVIYLIGRIKGRLQNLIGEQERDYKKAKGRASGEVLKDQLNLFKESITDLTVHTEICEVLRREIDKLRNKITIDYANSFLKSKKPTAALALTLLTQENNSTISILNFLRHLKDAKKINIFNHEDLQDPTVINDWKEKLIQTERRMQGLQHGNPDNDHIVELKKLIDSLIEEKVSIEPQNTLQIFDKEIVLLGDDHDPAN